MTEKKSTPIHRLLLWFVRQAYDHTWPMLLVLLSLFIISVVYTATSLKFNADRSSLVNPKERFKLLDNAFQQEFPHNEDVVVLFEGGTVKDREGFVDELAARLEPHKDLYRDVFSKVDLPFLKTHAFEYLGVGDLKRIVASLREARPMLMAMGSPNGMGGMLASSSHDLGKMLPMLNEVLGQLLESLKTRGAASYHSPWEKTFFSGVKTDEKHKEEADALKNATKPALYNTLEHGSMHLLLVRPGDDLRATLKNLYGEIDRLHMSYPDVEVGVTGSPVLDQDEMDSSMSDSVRAAAWSFVLISILFAFSFRNIARPFFALISLGVALGWTTGFTTLAIGHLNLLTVTFATMLIGLGVDFGIHIIFSYEEQRSRGLEPLAAMDVTVRHAGSEGFTGAFTTAIAFYAITFTDFRGIAELGWIAGTGVMLCFIAMVTLLPSLIFLQDKGRAGRSEEPRPAWADWLGRLEEVYLARPWPVVLVCLSFTLVCLSMVPRVHFDYNLLNLQSQKLPSVQTELKLLKANDTMFAVLMADDVQQARALTDRISRLPSVAKVESVAPLIPEDYAAKRPLIQEIESIMGSVPLPPANGAASATSGGLIQMGEGFKVLDQTFKQHYPELIRSRDPKVRTEAVRFNSLLTQLFATLQQMGPGPIADVVGTFQHNIFGDLRAMIGFLKAQQAAPEVSFSMLPASVRIRSIGTTGKILLRIYPRGNPWNRADLGVFVSELQKVAPDAVGAPIMVYYHTEALRKAFQTSGWLALGAIAIILLLYFRRLDHALLALLPKVVGVIWMVGFMGFFHHDFNPANFMALPLILGIGLIFGVHVVHRLLQSPHEGVFSHSTGPAIALSASTTMCGFGTLIMAKHQGIASLGFLMTFGVGASLITSLVLLPAVMRLVVPPRPAVLDPHDS